MSKSVLGGNFFDGQGDIIDRLTNEQLKVDKIKEQTDFLKLLDHFSIKVKKTGKNTMALCPFHDDKNPSLSIDISKKMFKCFACDKSGDVVKFVEYYKGIKFIDALKYLDDFNGLATGSQRARSEDTEKKKEEGKRVFDVPLQQGKINLDGVRKEQSTPRHSEQSEESTIDQSILLDRVVKKYCGCFLGNKNALDYLKGRGFSDLSLVGRFKIGFCDGKVLLPLLSKTQKETLKDIGILNKNGYEVFNNCLVFPVFDVNDRVVGVYGRNIDDKVSFKHLYLAGNHRSVFNRRSSKVYDEVILTESIIDALSLVQLGFNNTQACYGVNGFTDEMLEILKEDNVKSVVIAFDNDFAGKKGAEKLKERLVNENFQVKVIYPPVKPVPSGVEVKDWNEVLQEGIGKEEIEKLINGAVVFKKEEIKKDFIHRLENNHHIFIMGDITYRLAGVKDVFVTNLKVTITATMGDFYFPDTVDLCVYRSRIGFSNHLAGKFNVEPQRVENDLLKILRFLETERDSRLNPEEKKREKLTEEEIKLGMDFLKSETLIEDTIRDITNLGYMGEDSNKLLAYIIGLSRYLEKPLSLYVLSSAGTGKSHLVETVLLLFPISDVKHTSTLSDHAFPYMPEDDFIGKIYFMGEDLHSSIVEGYMRQMQTENRISRSVVKKNEKTGEMETINMTHDVNLVFMTTSTRIDRNIENLSRCILLKVDESTEQTTRILEFQRENNDYLPQLTKKHLLPEIIKKHVSSQMLLKPIRIYNPYAKYIQFPTHRALFRRSQPYFLMIIKVICYWRQYQKTPVLKLNPYTNLSEQWFECDFTDYELARNLFLSSNLLSYVDELPQPLIDLYESIRKMVKEKAQANDLSVTDTSFIQREIREITGLKNTSIKIYLKKLVDYEYIQLVGGRRHGTRFSYKLREDCPIQQVNPVSIIPTVNEIKAMMEVDSCNNNKN